MAVPPLGAEEPAALDVRRRATRARHSARAPRRPRGACGRSACSRAATTPRRRRVRFLHVVGARRRAARRLEPVDELTVGGSGTWRGRRRSSARSAPARRSARSRRRRAIDPAGERGALRAARRRDRAHWEALAGTVASGRAGRRRRRARHASRSRTRRRGRAATREAALRRTFCSTHAVLRAPARRVRLADRPARALRAAAARARNEGMLAGAGRRAGRRATRARRRRSSSRTTRGSRPRARATCSTAARSTSCSSLNILSLTDEEKAEMRATRPARARDPRAHGGAHAGAS